MSEASLATVPGHDHRAWPMRLWLAAPDWVFRVAGAIIFFAYFLSQAQKYWQRPFWQLGPYCEFPGGQVLRMPWVPVLTDLTFLLIALAFCFRLPPRSRASNGWVISYTLLTGFAPLIPIWISPALGWVNSDLKQAYDEFLFRQQISWRHALAFGVAMTVGMGIEVWGYAVLFRSLSIVPEPRELKMTGPYRFVRHPIYLGQFIAQGAFWLIAAQTHWVWIGLYTLFVAMQLYRSKLEDRVLAEAFGDRCRQWQARTFWFV